MPDKRISEFLDGGLVETGDEIAAVRGVDNYKVRVGSAAAYDAGQSGGELVILEEDSSGTVMLPAVSGEQLTNLPAQSDPTVAVSIDDIEAGYLEDKITGSASITVTKETDSAGVETLRLDVVGAGGVVAVSDGGTGATTAADAQINLGIVPSRDIQGGIISNNTTGAEHDIDVTALTCLDGTFATVMSVGAITKALDSTFAEGDGNGGMASGEALPTSGTIHIWAITKADGTGDVFANNDAASGLSPSLPSGFDNIRYLGSLITDSSANIVGIRHDGDMFELTDTSTNDIVIGSGVPTTPTAYGVFVPSGVPVMHRASYSMGSTANSSIRVRSPIDTDTSTPSLANSDLRCTASSVGAQSELTRYTENGQIVIHRGENDPTAGFRGKTCGWRNLARGVI